MSSAVSARSENSRAWWGLRTSSSRDFSEAKQSNSISFNNIASAIGLKSKKHPTLTIQDPPLSIRPFPLSPTSPISHQSTPRRPGTSPGPGRPASKSVSSTRSRVDSLGPRTPVDGQSNRQSLLTLSDLDPFAAGAVVVSPADPNRLSAYSNSSIPDYYFVKKSENPTENIRGSFASSALYSAELGPPSPTIPSAPPSPRRASTTKKIKKRNSPVEHEATNGGDSETVQGMDMNRLSQPDIQPAPRPRMRPRGMTDVGNTRELAQFIRDGPPAWAQPQPPPPTSPRVVVRQASISRAGMPTSAPPTHELPAPPPTGTLPSPPSLNRNLSTTSSLARSRVHQDPKHIVNKGSHRSLKKASSQQSLTARSPSQSVSSPSPPSEQPISGERILRKQRSFHHPRIPIPSIPLPLRPAPNVADHAIHAEGSALSDSKRGSTNGQPGRKRLFSGSGGRRPSTSHTEDDTRSLFSLKSDTHLPFNALEPSNSQSSFWEDGSSHPAPASPSVPDYAPQQIMSPAEMLKLEQSLQMESELQPRRRGMSVVSQSTVASSHTFESAVSTRSLTGWTGTGNGQNRIVSPKIHVPSSPGPTAQFSPPIASPSQTSIDTLETGMVGLAPPPRSWSRPSKPSSQQPEPVPDVLPLSPPPRKHVRRPTGERPIEKAMHRRSIMRKPSFLDIGGEGSSDEDNTDLPDVDGNSGSFLDFARESFDSTRTIEE